MSSRRLVIVLGCIAVAVILVGATACGSSTSGSSTTTVPFPTTVSTGPSTTSTAAAVSTSEAGTAPSSTSSSSAVTSTASSVALTPELQAYANELEAFVSAFDSAPDTSFLRITDPAAATAADIQQADTASTFVHKLLDQLVAIKPPAQVAALHTKLVGVFQAEVKAMDDFISALKNKDAAAMKIATDKGKQASADLFQVSRELDPYMATE